jgi:uncharacterized SAM-binding protein YcdF (DUF218 family)
MDLSFYIQKVLAELILPPASLLILTATGLLLIRRWPRVGHATAWTALVCLLLLSLPAVSTMLVRTASTSGVFSSSAAKDAQAIVILGGGRRYAPEYGGETVSISSLQRARYGAKLARELNLPILVTGGSVYGRGVSEADLMVQALENSFATPVKWIERRSRNTHENAQFSAQVLREAGIDTVVLVTHDIHQRRSMAEFAAVNIKTIPASVTLAQDTSRRSLPEHLPDAYSLMLSSLALHELIGYLVVAPKAPKDS